MLNKHFLIKLKIDLAQNCLPVHCTQVSSVQVVCTILHYVYIIIQKKKYIPPIESIVATIRWSTAHSPPALYGVFGINN